MSDFTDVSSYQDGLPLSSLVNDPCVVVKATEGTSYRFPHFAARVTEARAEGMKVGAYHFARPGDPAAQADYFADYVGQQADWVILDLEVPVGDATGFAAAFAARLARRGWATGWVYSGPSYVHANNLSLPPGWLGWLADYGVSAPAIPLGWAGRLAAWQYTSSALVGGRKVDRSHLYRAPWAPPAPSPAPPSPGGFLMALNDQEQADVYNRISAIFNILNFGSDPNYPAPKVTTQLTDLERRVEAIEAKLGVPQ